MEIDLDRPQTVYIVRNLDGRYCLHFDEPHLEKNGKFHSASGQWSDLEDFRWFLHGLNKGEYLKYNDGSWHQQDYIWLQETAYSKYGDEKEDYKRWCLTKQTDMNINSEHMFMLGKDGNFYIDTSCGGDYEIYRPFSKATFELIREEAIKNDGEYQVEE